MFLATAILLPVFVRLVVDAERRLKTITTLSSLAVLTTISAVLGLSMAKERVTARNDFAKIRELAERAYEDEDFPTETTELLERKKREVEKKEREFEVAFWPIGGTLLSLCDRSSGDDVPVGKTKTTNGSRERLRERKKGGFDQGRVLFSRDGSPSEKRSFSI
jgi:hypothetical protein